MRPFIEILFSGMNNGYLKYLDYIDDHWAYGSIKIPEYLFTISTADLIHENFGKVSGIKVIIEGSVDLIYTYSTSSFGGASFATSATRYKRSNKYIDDHSYINGMNRYTKRVDIVVCDKRPSFVPKYVIEIKGVNPAKKNICYDIDKIIKILNFKHKNKQNGLNTVESGFILGVTRLDSLNQIINSQTIDKKKIAFKEKMNTLLREKLNNTDIDFTYIQADLDSYTEEDYLAHPDPDKNLGDAQRMTHAYLSWAIELKRR